MLSKQKIKLIGLYLIYFLLFVLLIILSSSVSKFAEFKQATTFTISKPLLILEGMVFIALGAAFGLEYILRECKKQGKWKVNLPKIMSIGLLSLIFSLVQIFDFTAYFFLMSIHINANVFQMLLGYIIISSFEKAEIN